MSICALGISIENMISLTEKKKKKLYNKLSCILIIYENKIYKKKCKIRFSFSKFYRALTP